MITINIMRGASLVEAIKPDSASQQSKTIMGDNVITLQFDLSRKVRFRIGDWCEVFGEKYYLNRIPEIKKNSSRMFEYSLTMQSDYYELAKIQYMFYDENNELKKGAFSLYGTAADFIDLLLKNANRVSSGWTRAAVIETGYQNMTFNAENCLAVLGRIAQQFETEYYIQGRVITLDRKAVDRGRTLRVGKGKGLYSINERPLNDSNVVTRLYAFGAAKNLPPDYRNFTDRLMMTDGLLFLEKNTDKYGVVEQTVIMDDVYPHRTGKVTSVSAVNPFILRDTNIDFDVNNYLLPGIAAKLTFNTGQLTGYTFDIQRFDNINKQFTILKNKNEKAIDVPSTTFKPAIGDEYVLVDIQMPESYVTAAEAELKGKAQTLLDKVSEPQLEYPVVVDPAYFRKNSIRIDLGDMIWISDTQLEINRKIRVTAFTRSFGDEYNYTLTLSDGLRVDPVAELYSMNGNNQRAITDINGQINNRASENDFVGPVTMADLPETNDTTGMRPVYADADGKLFVKIP